jgi:hypothetical protein
MRLRFAASAAVALLLLATVGSALPSPPQLTKGTLEDGIYHHTATGTDIRLPAGWLIMGDSDSSSGGEAVMLRDSAGQSYSVWMISSSIPVANIPAALEHDADYKIHQHAVHGVHLKMRPRTLLKWPIGGGDGQALAVAFDLGQHGAKIEYDTWVRTGKTMVYFSSICPASSIRMIQDRFQILVSATVVPPAR